MAKTIELVCAADIPIRAKLPVLRGKVIKGLIYVHCPMCDREHVHEWTTDIRTPQHRVAHCHSGPYLDQGYYVAPFRIGGQLG
jgi:hypothetical protein